MQKETEIKLRASRETLAALREHPLLKKRNKSGWERCELFNQYFDTPARDLAQAKVAIAAATPPEAPEAPEREDERDSDEDAWRASQAEQTAQILAAIRELAASLRNPA